MTRTDPSGEPSMEDILASIRKIIAEDPPGSRPAPEQRPQPSPSIAPSQAFRTLQREPEASTAVISPSPEPYLRSDSQPPFQPMSAFQTAGLSEPRHKSADPLAVAPAPAGLPARGLSVDDQLSELLGEVPISAPEPIARPVPRSISASPGFIAKMTAPAMAHSESTVERHHAAPSNEAALGNGAGSIASSASAAPAPSVHIDPAVAVQAQIEPAIAERAGFTVSRAGYIPDAPAAQPSPFDFQLGPSPFTGKLYAADPVLPSAAAPASETALKASHSDLGSIVPSRHFDFAGTDEAHQPSLRVPRPVPGFEPRGEAQAARARAEPEIQAAVAKPVAEVEHRPIVAPALAETAAMADVEAGAAPITTVESPAVANSVPMPQVMTLETLLPPSAVAIAESAVIAETAALVETPLPIAAIATPVAVDDSPAAQQGALAAEYLSEIEAMTPEVEAEEAAGEGEISQCSMMFNGAQSGARSSQFTPAFDHQQVAPYSEPNAPERSMEDTVAELLRPMLKNWLAENMPKIVERALRREIEESFALEHKPAAE